MFVDAGHAPLGQEQVRHVHLVEGLLGNLGSASFSTAWKMICFPSGEK